MTADFEISIRYICASMKISGNSYYFQQVFSFQFDNHEISMIFFILE